MWFPRIYIQLNTTDTKLKYVVLNIISFGLWNHYQNKQFKSSLVSNDQTKASQIFAKCTSINLRESLVRELLTRRSIDSLSWIASRDYSTKISDFIFLNINSSMDMDNFLCKLSKESAARVVTSLFDQTGKKL